MSNFKLYHFVIKQKQRDHTYGSGTSRKFAQTTKKVGCPALVTISEVVAFPDFKVIGV